MPDYFCCEAVSPRVRRLRLPGDVYAYLIDGAERAALIDTGCGLGDLRAYVESLTDKALTVLLTHGHVDHAPGAAQFDLVYMSPRDREVYSRHDQIAMRADYLNGTSSKGQFEPAQLLPEHGVEAFRPLEEGMRFDLGGLHITGYACPGHTPGSFVFLLEEEETLLLGDACNPFTFLFDCSASGVSSYEEQLKALLGKVKGRYRRVLCSHGDGEPSAKMIEEAIQVCKDIKARNVEDLPFQFMGHEARIAHVPGRLNARGQVMADIVYDPSRIEE